jgi:hypothetical protein
VWAGFTGAVHDAADAEKGGRRREGKKEGKAAGHDATSLMQARPLNRLSLTQNERAMNRDEY